eukprot:1334880-Amorphochlora_amoeboformis.AAC.1
MNTRETCRDPGDILGIMESRRFCQRFDRVFFDIFRNSPVPHFTHSRNPRYQSNPRPPPMTAKVRLRVSTCSISSLRVANQPRGAHGWYSEGILNLAAIALIALGALGQDITCKKFKDIYDNGNIYVTLNPTPRPFVVFGYVHQIRVPQLSGTDLCETMWDGAFKVVDNYSAAYTMWFFDAINPNDAISQTLHPTGNTSVCNLDFYHKDFPTPEGENFTECHPWKQ